MVLLNVYSLDVLGIPREQQNDLCYLPKAEWRRLMHLDCPDILLLNVQQGDVKCTLTVGDCHEQEEDNIYIPYHCMGPFLEGAEAVVTRCLEMPPWATKIVLQPLDNELYHCDIAGAVSKVFSCWNILEKNTVVSVPCEELGGYLVDVFIKDLEPADTVLLRGECPMELAEPLEQILEWTKTEDGKESNEEIPEGVWRPVERSLTTDAKVGEVAEVAESSHTTGFIPFGGKGNRLGS